MGCSLDGITSLIVLMVALLGFAIFFGVTLFLPGAITAAIISFILFFKLKEQIEQYQKCRDQEKGNSKCSTKNTSNYLNAIRASIGIAIGAFASALGVIWIPVAGPVAAEDLAIVGEAACGVAIILLLALLAEMKSYSSCRDKEDALTGTSGNPLGGTGGTRPTGPTPTTSKG